VISLTLDLFFNNLIYALGQAITVFFKTCEKPLNFKFYILMKSVTKKISPSVGLILCYTVTIF